MFIKYVECTTCTFYTYAFDFNILISKKILFKLVKIDFI